MPIMNDVFFENKPKSVAPLGKKMRTQAISYTKLEESALQYRNIPKEDVMKLADLIMLDGEVLQPLLVRKNGGDTYEILAGHKRYLACKYIVEELNDDTYSMLPCYVKDLSDAKAEFAVYSTNGYSTKSQFQIMKEIEGMKRLLEEHPEEFVSSAKGRLVEKIAKEMGLSRSTVSEYQNISHNLGAKGMEKFEKGEINKSAANTLASLPEDKQNEILDSGITKDTEIKKKIHKSTKSDNTTAEISIDEVSDELKHYVLHEYLTDSHREKIGVFYQTNKELKYSEVGQEIKQIIGTQYSLFHKDEDKCIEAKQIGLSITYEADGYSYHCIVPWRNLAIWIKEELEEGRFLASNVLPGQTTMKATSIKPIENNEEEFPEIYPGDYHKVALDITSDIPKDIELEKMGLCPSCKSKIVFPFNKYFCGQCGSSVDWS